MRMIRPSLTALAVLSATLGLTACNFWDDGDPVATTKTVTVTPSLGRITNAHVRLRNAATLQELGLSPLNDSGAATFTIPSTVSNVVAELVPNNTTRYFDEAVPDDPLTPANESLVPFPVTETLHSAFTLPAAASANVGMTALTEAAYQRAVTLAGAGGLNAALINQANAYVQQVFNVSNILQAPAVIGATGDYAALLNADAAAREYAMRLAALAKQARTGSPASTQPAIDMMKALSADLADGALDRKGPSGDLADLPYADPGAFQAAWVKAMQDMLASLQTSLADKLTAAQLEALSGYFTTLASQIKITPSPVIMATPVRELNGIAEYACTDEGKLKSLSGPALDIDFINQRGSAISIYWLDNTGTRKPYKAAMASGLTHTQPTFVTHPWLVTNSTGQCVGIYVPVTGGKKILTFKADNSVTLGVPDAGTDNTVPATVNPALVGAYTLVYHAVNAGGPYAADQQLVFTVGADGSLHAGDKALTNPRFARIGGVPYTGEVLWEDGNIQYFLTNNTTGQFSEININDKTRSPSFLGQFRKPAVTSPCGALTELTASAVAPLAGTYNVTIWKSSDTSPVNTEVKKTTAVVAADGKVTLDGQVANATSFCENFNNVTHQTGVIINLDKKDAFGGDAHVDLWTDGTINGVDFTVTTENRFFDGSKQASGGGGGGTGSCSGSTGSFGCLTISGSSAPVSIFEYKNPNPPVFKEVIPGAGTLSYPVVIAPDSSTSGITIGFNHIVINHQQLVFNFMRLGPTTNLLENVQYQCKDANENCPGLQVDTANRRVVFDGVVAHLLDSLGAQTATTITLNGVLTY